MNDFVQFTPIMANQDRAERFWEIRKENERKRNWKNRNCKFVIGSRCPGGVAAPAGAVTTLLTLMRIQEYFTISSCITQVQEEFFL